MPEPSAPSRDAPDASEHLAYEAKLGCLGPARCVVNPDGLLFNGPVDRQSPQMLGVSSKCLPLPIILWIKGNILCILLVTEQQTVFANIMVIYSLEIRHCLHR